MLDSLTTWLHKDKLTELERDNAGQPDYLAYTRINQQSAWNRFRWRTMIADAQQHMVHDPQ